VTADIYQDHVDLEQLTDAASKIQNVLSNSR